MLPLAAVPAGAQRQYWPYNEAFMPPRGRLGVQVQPMTPELRQHFKAPADRGLLVTRVEPDRPAARAGVHVGDVIIAAGGEPVREPFDLVKIVGRVPAGDTLELRVVRDQGQQTLTVTPTGAATPWVDPDYWSKWLEEGLHQGSRELRHQLEELQRRLDELERKFDEQRKPATPEKQKT